MKENEKVKLNKENNKIKWKQKEIKQNKMKEKKTKSTTLFSWI